MLVDTHCHLDQYPEPERVIEEALAVGVTRIVALSENRSSMEKVLSLKAQFPQVVLAGLAIHPMHLQKMTAQEITESLRFVEDHLAQADVVGESGLDHLESQSDADKERQREVLHRLFALAAQHHKPVNLHSRRAQRAVLSEAIEFSRQSHCKAQLHWFTESVKLARLCAQEGIYISVGPAVLFRPEVERVVQAIDPNLLLLETDGPVSFGGEEARPAWIARIVEKVAQVYSLSTAALTEKIWRNFETFLHGSSVSMSDEL